jgi:predicted GNAT family acetyltransferase
VNVDLNNLSVTHDEAAQRFELLVDGARALLTYRRFPDRILLLHTEVPQPFEGHGLAARLSRSALDFARTNHLRVVPLCPYVSSFIQKHPEYQDLVAPDDLRKLLSS